MDLGFLPQRPGALVTLSGIGEVVLWDLNQPTLEGVQCIGHDSYARSFAYWSDNPRKGAVW